MSESVFGNNPPPFWKQFGYFFNYIKEEKLYFQITLLAAANILLLIPSLVIYILVAAMLFLASYKLAFEVLHTVSSGHMSYQDLPNYQIDDKIGFKAMVMPIIQLLIFFFIFRTDPPVGTALLIITTGVTPAFLMMLSKTQNVVDSLNPINLSAVMSRIGFEYWLLLIFFLLCQALNLLVRYLVADSLPGIVGEILTAWILYFLLVYTFAITGYVMYRHADELGHDTIDTEEVKTTSTHVEDPIKDRIKAAIAANNPADALAIIKEVQQEEQRPDLESYKGQAEQMLTLQQRIRPADQLQQLVDSKQYKAAIELILNYMNDGHLIKPKEAITISKLIHYAFDNNRYQQVLKLCRDFDKRYPLNPQQIVDNYFLVVKIYYQNKKTDQAVKLLQSLIKKYQGQANIQPLNSYLKGIQKLNNR